MRAMNLTLLTDLYELTMMQGYFKNPTDQIVVFDAFYRHNPCDGGYAVAAGLEQVIEYIRNLHFTSEMCIRDRAESLPARYGLVKSLLRIHYQRMVEDMSHSLRIHRHAAVPVSYTHLSGSRPPGHSSCLRTLKVLTFRSRWDR